MASVQTLHLARHASQLQAALDQLRTQRSLQRLWEKDASLWSQDASAQAAIRQRLGWLTASAAAARQVPSWKALVTESRQAGLTHALLLGMGGSSLFPDVCRKIFGAVPEHIDLTVLDTTDPTAIRVAQQRCPLNRLLTVVSSKSGTTAEVGALSKYFYETLRSAGSQPGSHCIAITDAGTPLEAEASTWKFRRVVTLAQDTGADVGGRFSALTAFGLVPAMLMGIDPQQLLDRANEMFARCSPGASLSENPAAQLGAVLGVLASEGKDKLTLLAPRGLESFWSWVEQLVAESTGKQGQGIAPVYGEPPQSASAYSADRVFIELQLASQPDEALERQVEGLVEAGHAVVRIRWQDRYDVGAEVVKWSIATAITGSFLGVNPFDEPDVNETKAQTKTLLSQYVEQGRFPSETPLLCDGELTVYGTGNSVVTRSLGECLGSFFRQCRDRDYLVLISFLPRTAALDQAVGVVRDRLVAGLRHATLLVVGPRYLHSIGQLFKGGSNTGLFLLLTADEPSDLPIPGEPYTFGVLKQAQALGDFHAMQQKDRRILRVHLGGPLERSTQHLLRAIDEALATATKR